MGKKQAFTTDEGEREREREGKKRGRERGRRVEGERRRSKEKKEHRIEGAKEEYTGLLGSTPIREATAMRSLGTPTRE